MTDLVERVAAAIAPGYRTLPLEDAAGLLLLVHMESGVYQLAPFALELTAVDEDVHPDGYQDELGAPQFWEDPALLALGEELIAQVETDDHYDYPLLETYFLVLAAHIHALIGIPVLVNEIEMPIAEQLRRQTGTPPDSDPLAGMDVLVRIEIDEQRVAAVVLRHGEMVALSRADDPDGGWGIGPGLQALGGNPQVLAGMLPHGAATVVVQDRAGTWHEATVGGGAWLCVLPQHSTDEDPPFAYLRPDGERFEPDEQAWVFTQRHEDVRQHEGTVRAGATVPALWPAQAHIGAFFSGWEGPRACATGLSFAHAEWVVSITTNSPTATEVYERRLIDSGIGFAAAKKRMRKVGLSQFHGTVAGQTAVFALATSSEAWRSGEGWAAVTHGDGFTVSVQCGASVPAPDRLDLEPV